MMLEEVSASMAYQYVFCPTCNMRRAAYGYRCSVCDSLVRRTPVQAARGLSPTNRVWNLPRIEKFEPTRQPVAA
jgi:DNA-directed RNA polymerase subunit RPC12/RpoP